LSERPLAHLERKRRVLVGDDDMSGLIYYPVIYQYMSEGEQELFEELGHPSWTDIAAGIAAPVVHSECDYRSATRAGEVLTHRVDLHVGRRTSIRFHHRFAGHDGREVFDGTVVRVWVDLSSMEPVPVPEWLASRNAVSGA
jgi:YbgC/YbaW family acyl-CoA thioester hydrolase